MCRPTRWPMCWPTHRWDRILNFYQTLSISIQQRHWLNLCWCSCLLITIICITQLVLTTWNVTDTLICIGFLAHPVSALCQEVSRSECSWFWSQPGGPCLWLWYQSWQSQFFTFGKQCQCSVLIRNLSSYNRKGMKSATSKLNSAESSSCPNHLQSILGNGWRII